MRIRKAEKDDILAVSQQFVSIQQAHVAAYPFKYKPISVADAQSILLERLEHPGFYVAELEGEVVGYLVYEIMKTEQTKILCERRYCYIQQIGVNKERRKLGIGEALINHVKLDCQNQLIEDVELNVWAFNSGGYGFFKKVDFEQYGFKLKLARS